MKIETYNFPDHVKGNTFSGAEFTINVDGTPLDLTSAAVEMVLKVWDNEGDNAVLSLNTSITDASNGVFEIDSQTIDIPAHCYVYDIKITLQSGSVKTYIRGSFNVIQNIS